MHDYSDQDIKRLFNLSLALLRALGKAGYITAPSGEAHTSYSFQDLLVLRMASALNAAKIPAAKIIAALGRIRSTLPPGAVLTTMALAASGKDVVVRERGQVWEATSGQYALPLVPPTSKRSQVSTLPAAAARAPQRPQAEADAHYSRGHALEQSDVEGARTAYLKALEAHRDHVEARINLGRLLHLNGELEEAEKVYRQAKTSSALLSFNLATLLEDLNREEEAVAAYREALAQDPLLHDAHFNLSRLHEKAEQPRDALRHLLAYHRHVAKYGE